MASVLVLASTVPTTAQPAPGDVVVVAARHVLHVTPGGVVTTLASLPTGHLGRGVGMAFGTRGVVVLSHDYYWNISTHLLQDLTAGKWTTVGFRTAQGATPFGHAGIARDQRGDYVLNGLRDVLRISRTGSVVTMAAAQGSGLCCHLGNGGWLCFGRGQSSHLTRGGVVTTLGPRLTPGWTGVGSLIADTSSGDTFVACPPHLYRFDVATATYTTIPLTLHPGIGQPICGDFDHPTRTIVLGTSNGVYRLSREGLLLQTFAQFTGGAVGLTLFASNRVSVVGPMKPGTRSAVHVSFPNDPGRSYQLGASFGFSPGIPTRRGVIPLRADPLLALSLNAPTLFQGFSGRLDASGAAQGAIILPNLRRLTGARFFVAGVTYAPGGRLLGISEPVGLTVE